MKVTEERSRVRSRFGTGVLIAFLLAVPAAQAQDQKEQKKDSRSGQHERSSGRSGSGGGQAQQGRSGQQNSDTAQPPRGGFGGRQSSGQGASQNPAPSGGGQQSSGQPSGGRTFGRQNPQNPGQAPSQSGQPSQASQPQSTSQQPSDRGFGRQNAGQAPQGGSSQPQNSGQPSGGRQFGRQDNAQQPPQGTDRPGNRPTQGGFGRQGMDRPAGQSGASSPQGRPQGGFSGGPGGPGRSSGQPQVTRYPDGRQTIRTSNGGMVHRDAGGQVREVRTPGGAVIMHRPDGVRRVEVARPGNRIIVTTDRGRGGYAQRPVMFHNREFIQRTYYSHGVSYVRVYRPVTYRGVVLNLYTPVRYYRPAFYVYAYTPWSRPVYYSWGWVRSPWYVHYGGYFVPYREYYSPALWLTDYLLALTLEEAYQQRMEANLAAAQYAQGGPTPLTPDVKQAISEEVRRQIELERNEGQAVTSNGSYGDRSTFDDNVPHVFVVNNSLTVGLRGGGACTVSEGDVLQTAPGQANGMYADTVVLASKGTDCRKGEVVSVDVQDLQDMQNHMRETVDRGLADMQSGQGRNGMPALPAAAAAPPMDAPIASEVRPEADVASELSQAAQEADRGEQDVMGQSSNLGPDGGGPVTISLGQSISEVEAINGRPQKIIDLGARRIYVYPDIKITFTDGRVSDVQ